MQYLFRGILPLSMPPLPTVEIREGGSRSISDLLAKEVCADTLQTAGVSKTGHLHVSEAPPPVIVSVIIISTYTDELLDRLDGTSVRLRLRAGAGASSSMRATTASLAGARRAPAGAAGRARQAGIPVSPPSALRGQAVKHKATTPRSGSPSLLGRPRVSAGHLLA